MDTVAAVLLAAGRGARMGADKLALRVGERSLLAHALAAWNTWGAADVGPGRGEPRPYEPSPPRFISSHIARVLVVRPDQPLPPEATDWQVVENPLADAGMGTSLAAGVAAVEADAYLLGLADMPALAPATVAALVAAWQAGAGPLVRPTWRGRQGHPVLADLSLRPRLLACAGDEGARSLVRELGCALVPVEDPGAVLDVDRPDDLAGLELRGETPRWKEAWWPSPS